MGISSVCEGGKLWRDTCERFSGQTATRAREGFRTRHGAGCIHGPAGESRDEAPWWVSTCRHCNKLKVYAERHCHRIREWLTLCRLWWALWQAKWVAHQSVRQKGQKCHLLVHVNEAWSFCHVEWKWGGALEIGCGTYLSAIWILLAPVVNISSWQKHTSPEHVRCTLATV